MKGGFRTGSGRKPLDPNNPSAVLTVRVTKFQKAKAERLGWAAWVRKQIDKAKEPS